MPLYTVLAPKGAGRSAADPMDLVFVKEGFCWPALFIPEIWLIFRRMWLVLVLDIAVVVVAMMLQEQIGEPLVAATLLVARLLFALEGNGLRRWTLLRNGYEIIGVALGGNQAEAEWRFYSDYEPPAQASREPPPPPPEAPPPPRQPAPGFATESRGAIGLFPKPGGQS